MTQRIKKGNVQTFGRVEGYEKYVHPVYGYEVVLDTNNNNKIVIDPVNIGTYNYFNPGNLRDNVRHGIFDVIPYYWNGNESTIYSDGRAKEDQAHISHKIGRLPILLQNE